MSRNNSKFSLFGKRPRRVVVEVRNSTEVALQERPQQQFNVQSVEVMQLVSTQRVQSMQETENEAISLRNQVNQLEHQLEIVKISSLSSLNEQKKNHVKTILYVKDYLDMIRNCLESGQIATAMEFIDACKKMLDAIEKDIQF